MDYNPLVVLCKITEPKVYYSHWFFTSRKGERLVRVPWFNHNDIPPDLKKGEFAYKNGVFAFSLYDMREVIRRELIIVPGLDEGEVTNSVRVSSLP